MVLREWVDICDQEFGTQVSLLEDGGFYEIKNDRREIIGGGRMSTYIPEVNDKHTWVCILTIDSDMAPLVNVLKGELISRHIIPVRRPKRSYVRGKIRSVNQKELVQAVINCVAKAHGIPTEAILSQCKEKRRAEARQIAMYLAREVSDASLPELGSFFRRHHTTVMHSIRNVQMMRDVQPELNRQLKYFRQQVENVCAYNISSLPGEER